MLQVDDGTSLTPNGRGEWDIEAIIDEKKENVYILFMSLYTLMFL